MRLPFDQTQFLEVFAGYNATFGAAVAVWWILTAGLVVMWLRRDERSNRWIAWLLALQWIWTGSVYHLVFFRRINPAATLFGALFILEGILLLGNALRRQPLDYQQGSQLQRTVGAAFLVYGLLYPLLVVASGFEYPFMPVFAVPCPLTLVTIGWLISISPRAPRRLLAIPLLWCVIASSAAVQLDVLPDVALIVGGAALVVYAFRVEPFATGWSR